jgi:hypothetical protein
MLRLTWPAEALSTDEVLRFKITKHFLRNYTFRSYHLKCKPNENTNLDGLSDTVERLGLVEDAGSDILFFHVTIDLTNG